MNKVVLMGRLTRDPNVRYSQKSEESIAMARFTLAVDRRGSRAEEQQTADFISCVAFRNQAVFAENYLHQGTKVVLEGRLQTGSYTNKDGQKVYTTDVMIESLEFAESKNASRAAGQDGKSRPEPQAAAGEGFMNIPDGVEDEGLPFE